MPLALTGYQIGLLAIALTFIAFALTASMLVSRRWPRFPGRQLWIFGIVAVLFFAGQLTAVLLLATHESQNEAQAAPTTQTTQTTATQATTTQTATTPPTTTATQATTSTTTGGTAGQGDPVAGKKIFLSQPCGGCHTLADAGTSGTVGPNLDQLKPPFDKVVTQVTNGGKIMPPFKGQLTPQQIQDVAAYVSSVAGK